MSLRKVIDHSATGKQKLAVARTKDRSLDSLTSPRDKRIAAEINKNSDRLWKEAIAKRKEERAAKQGGANKAVVQQPKQLSKYEQNRLRILKRAEKRLLDEALKLEEQGKKKPANNRRYQRNRVLEKIKNLTKGTTNDPDV